MLDHNYISTACLHELHDACRQRCKFCDAPCGCDCHTKDGNTKKLGEAIAQLTE